MLGFGGPNIPPRSKPFIAPSDTFLSTVFAASLIVSVASFLSSVDVEKRADWIVVNPLRTGRRAVLRRKDMLIYELSLDFEIV